jgi:DMSO/TMAO reductase YedYZ molybdopterin-dependent catalytic subunit
MRLGELMDDVPPDVPADVPPERGPAVAHRTVVRARVAGAVAAAVALATGELVSALGATASTTGQSLVGSVGSEIVDRSTGGLVKAAIEVFGTADKAVLVLLVVAVCLALGAVLGSLGLRRRWVGPAGFVAFGVLGAGAGLRDPLASDPLTVAAATAAVAAGIVTLTVLLRVARDDGVLPVATTRTIESPADPTASRRAFFGWAGAAGALAATATVAARALSGRGSVEAARADLRLPAPVGDPTGTSPPVGLGSPGLDVPGLTPYLVPNDDFYRIDTALIVPQVDPATWTLTVTGMVDEEIVLDFEDLLALPMVERTVTLSCVSNEVGGRLVGNAVWQGVPLTDLLDRAGVRPDATQIVGRSVDGFTAGFPTEVARDGRTALVAVGMNGEPLPVLHGFPARLVVAGLYGYVSATKWLKEIRLTRWEDVDGYWIPRGWAKEAPVKTQSRIDVPRSGARLTPGPTPIAGVAWAPDRGVRRVEVRIDDGEWRDARLGDASSDETWVQWVLEWDAAPGDHTIVVRATDGTGETQTERASRPDPDGATGWHRRRVTVAGA